MKNNSPLALSDPGLWRILMVLFLLSCSCTSWAQWSGSVALASEYIYRGNSLSQGRPAVQVNVNVDGESGVFAGGFLSKSISNEQSQRGAQAIMYAGMAQRLSSGTGWEVGVTRVLLPDIPRWNYTEIFTGISRDDMNLRVHYSSDYLGLKKESLYVEWNGDLPLDDQWNIYAHVGALSLRERSPQHDLRVGIAWNRGSWFTQLAWGKMLRSDESRLYFDRPSHQLTLSVRRAF